MESSRMMSMIVFFVGPFRVHLGLIRSGCKFRSLTNFEFQWTKTGMSDKFNRDLHMDKQLGLDGEFG